MLRLNLLLLAVIASSDAFLNLFGMRGGCGCCCPPAIPPVGGAGVGCAPPAGGAVCPPVAAPPVAAPSVAAPPVAAPPVAPPVAPPMAPPVAGAPIGGVGPIVAAIRSPHDSKKFCGP
ncbi:hypothetical protein Aduo_014543 [Ancylostoma duodenale]